MTVKLAINDTCNVHALMEIAGSDIPERITTLVRRELARY